MTTSIKAKLNKSDGKRTLRNIERLLITWYMTEYHIRAKFNFIKSLKIFFRNQHVLNGRRDILVIIIGLTRFLHCTLLNQESSYISSLKSIENLNMPI